MHARGTHSVETPPFFLDVLYNSYIWQHFLECKQINLFYKTYIQFWKGIRKNYINQKTTGKLLTTWRETHKIIFLLKKLKTKTKQKQTQHLKLLLFLEQQVGQLFLPSLQDFLFLITCILLVEVIKSFHTVRRYQNRTSVSAQTTDETLGGGGDRQAILNSNYPQNSVAQNSNIQQQK